MNRVLGILIRKLLLYLKTFDRLYHVDDVPSGAAGDNLDFKKAYVVSCDILRSSLYLGICSL